LIANNREVLNFVDQFMAVPTYKTGVMAQKTIV
jgi:hypothetical protein